MYFWVLNGNTKVYTNSFYKNALKMNGYKLIYKPINLAVSILNRALAFILPGACLPMRNSFPYPKIKTYVEPPQIFMRNQCNRKT